MINSLLTFGAKSVKPEILEQTLTGRKDTVNEIEKNCINKTQNSSTWQSLIISPRGSGKTHIIKVLYHRLKNNKKISDKSVIAYMSEDEVGISDFTDLMVSILRAFARYSEIGSETLETQISEASLIKDSQKREIFVKNILIGFANKKIIILLIENFDKILKSLGSHGQGSLRDFVHQYNNLSIIATSQNLISNLQDSKNPFYNFFNVFQLEKLDFERTIRFLEAIAKSEGNTKLISEINKPEFKGKLRAIYELTEGNHRLLVTFYSFLKADFKSELSGVFVKVMNDLKPYYEQFVNVLPTQQQKIVKHLSLNRGAISGKEIARACFIETNVFSKQISLLYEKGMIDKNKSGKDVFYEIKEPLMRICFEISENPDGISRLFVNFLSIYYDRKDIRNKYIKYEYGARFQCKEIKSKYEQEALMYSMALNEPEREKISFARKILDRIDNNKELENTIHSPDTGLLKQVDLSYESFKKGNIFLEKNQYEEAIKHFQKAAKSYPENEFLFLKTGIAQIRLGKHEDALENCIKAVEINPEYEWAFLLMGIAFLDIKQYKKAIEAFQIAIGINPENDRTFIGIGSAFSNLKQYKDAIDAFQKAIEINTENEGAFLGMGMVFLDLKQYKKAVEAFQKVIEINPINELAFYWMGNAFFNLKQYKEAIEVFQKAVEINPKNERAFYEMGIAFSNLKQDKDAIEAYQKAVEINPENEGTFYKMGIAFSNLKQYKEAIEAYQKAVEINLENEEAYLGIGIAFLSLEKYKEATEAFQKALEINPINEWAFYWMGVTFSNLKQYKKSIEAFQKAVKINPKNEDAFHRIGIAFSNLKQDKEAIEAFQKAIEINPDNDMFYNSIGLIYLRVNKTEKAFEAFHKGLKINPDKNYTKFSLLGAYIRLNDQNKSKEIINNLVRKVDNDLLTVSLTEDVFYNLFRFGSDAFIRFYFDFLLCLMFKEKKSNQLWKALPDSLFDILINIENYDKERLDNIEKILIELLPEYQESIIPLKMFTIGVAYLKHKEKNALFKLSKEERKLFKEAVLNKIDRP